MHILNTFEFCYISATISNWRRVLNKKHKQPTFPKASVMNAKHFELSKLRLPMMIMMMMMMITMTVIVMMFTFSK